VLYKYKDSSRAIFASTFFSETAKKRRHIILVIRQVETIKKIKLNNLFSAVALALKADSIAEIRVKFQSSLLRFQVDKVA
jgi:hypothetical protein